jgi:tetratricopeptide (TPR) repeat protein
MFSLATLYLDEDKTTEALQLFTRIEAKFRNNPSVLVNIGACYEKKGEYQKAAEYYKNVTEFLCTACELTELGESTWPR